jgi:hypothetical protein
VERNPNTGFLEQVLHAMDIGYGIDPWDRVWQRARLVSYGRYLNRETNSRNPDPSSVY